MTATKLITDRLEALELKYSKTQKKGFVMEITEEASLLLDEYMNTHTIPDEIYYRAMGSALVLNAKPSTPLILNAERVKMAIADMEAAIARLKHRA